MIKRAIIAGVTGWIVLAAWTFVINGVVGFKNRIDMKPVQNEQEVYATLKSQVTQPGKYVCNPPMTDTGFVLNEPVYSIQYAGIGHESAGKESLTQLIFALLASLTATGLLAATSNRVLAKYGNRVLFFAAIGLFVAFAGEMPKYGIGGYPMSDTLILATHAVVQWTVVGLVVAWRLKPFNGRR